MNRNGITYKWSISLGKLKKDSKVLTVVPTDFTPLFAKVAERAVMTI